MRIKNFTYFLMLGVVFGWGQNKHRIKAQIIYDSQSTVYVQHEISYHNQTSRPLGVIYLSDWVYSYSNEKTALAQRFAEEFNRALHLAKDIEKGNTLINSVTNSKGRFLDWEREGTTDLIRVELPKVIKPGDTYKMQLTYTVLLPSDKFTSYGAAKNGDLFLRDWYLSPLVYENGWKRYSNKNLDDRFAPLSNYELELEYPANYRLTSDFEAGPIIIEGGVKKVLLTAVNRSNCNLFLQKKPDFKKYDASGYQMITDLKGYDLSPLQQKASVKKVTTFINDFLGEYPYKQLLVSQLDYKKNPLYGLSQIPKFLRLYGSDFQYELELLKTTLNVFLSNTLLLDPRKERWVTDALQIYLLLRYIEINYPNAQLLGNLSNVWGVRSYSLAQMGFNEKYAMLMRLMARKNLNQSLNTPSDSLIKFNEKITNKYKAGLGLLLLGEYGGKPELESSIKKFYDFHRLKPVSASNFERALSKGINKDLSWFFENYVKSRKKIDFKIKKVRKSDDQLQVTIRNKHNSRIPVALYGLKRDSVVSQLWFDKLEDQQTVVIPRNNADKVVLNYNSTVPEINHRNNWKSLSGLFSGKKFKFKFFKDAEDPRANQLFWIPVFTFNVYDGFTPGIRLSNKGFISKMFTYDVQPFYSFGQKTLVGSGKLIYRKLFDEGSLYRMKLMLVGNTFHYDENARYQSFTPILNLDFRTPDFRSNLRHHIMLRYVSIFRDEAPNVETDPDYNVLNGRYIFSNNGIVDYVGGFADVQWANNFSKASLNFEFRKLFRNNRQLNLRFFGGIFLRNKTTDSDFFSFALDRPTDYLFDFNYLGRSEESGFTSQQIILAEGGFKSMLEQPFANEWITTLNGSFNLWRWIELYGDVGFVKNRGIDPFFAYDSGVRFNLVTDYLELYFPVYSNNGWEIAQPNYEERIRFLLTIRPRTLLKLFTRKWF